MKVTMIALIAALVLGLAPVSANAQNAPDLDCDIVGQIPGVTARGRQALLLLRCFDEFAVCHAVVTVDSKGTQLLGDFECDPLVTVAQ